jgi:hypothetical protein
LDKNYNTTRKTLSRMYAAGVIKRDEHDCYYSM